jgi:hypothetical protein
MSVCNAPRKRKANPVKVFQARRRSNLAVQIIDRNTLISPPEGPADVTKIVNISSEGPASIDSHGKGKDLGSIDPDVPKSKKNKALSLSEAADCLCDDDFVITDHPLPVVKKKNYNKS